MIIISNIKPGMIMPCKLMPDPSGVEVHVGLVISNVSLTYHRPRNNLTVYANGQIYERKNLWGRASISDDWNDVSGLLALY